MTPEGKVKALIKRTITKQFPKAYSFMPVQNGMGVPGLDFFYCILGTFVAIEAKAPGKKMTERQQVTALAITAAGGLVFCVDGIDSLSKAVATLRNLTLTRACQSATLQG